MKRPLNQHLMVALLGVAFTTELHAQTNAFTYQGQLTDNGSPANGFFDITFSIWNNASGPSQVGLTLTNNAVPVSDGPFTVTLDFGAGAFDGNDRWLEIGAATNGSGAFMNLSPRQRITSAPYAVQAGNAAIADSVPAGNITGTINLTQLPTTILTNGASGVNISGSFAGDGSGLTSLDSASLTGILTVNLLRNIGHTNYGGHAYGVAVSGNYAYLANGDDGLRVYDITDPAHPINVANTYNGAFANGVAVSGNYAYLANGNEL